MIKKFFCSTFKTSTDKHKIKYWLNPINDKNILQNKYKNFKSIRSDALITYAIQLFS